MKAADSMPEIGDILPRSNLHATAREGEVLRTFAAGCVDTAPRAVPWWLWWNLLSLDAPTVAVVWALLFAGASGNRLSVAEATALGLSVWIIYTCDRLLDGWTARNRTVLQERHLFCERHRFALSALALAASAVVLRLMTDGSLSPEAIAGVKLGGVLLLYMAAVHAGRGRLANVLPKEIFVGFLFAVGATLPLWSRGLRFSWREFLPWAFFAVLCTINCLSIECWESNSHDAGWRQPPHPFVRWAATRINPLAAALAVAALAACLVSNSHGPSRFALLPVCAGALLTLFLNCLRSRFSSTALRVLADAVLLFPALLALILRS